MRQAPLPDREIQSALSPHFFVHVFGGNSDLSGGEVAGAGSLRVRLAYCKDIPMSSAALPEIKPDRGGADAPREAGAEKSRGEGNVLEAAKAAVPFVIVPNPQKFKKDRSFGAVMGSTAAGILVAYLLGRSGWFTPGDDVGYYLGLVGGVLMLLLLLYPLRKHVAALRNWGAVKHWFSVHMILGISGPVLVLAHSTFHMHSTNAAVALICMLVVAGSGIVGRYFYTKVHRGLYGEKLNLKELQTESGLESAQIKSRLHFAPDAEKRLADFQAFALAKRDGLGSETMRFLMLGARRHGTYKACRNDLAVALRAAANARGWDEAKYQRRLKAATDLAAEFLGATQRVAEFGVYDRLLQLWHVAHVPLVYLLVISAIAHVVAVHMY